MEPCRSSGRLSIKRSPGESYGGDKSDKKVSAHLPFGTVGGFFVCTLAVALFTCRIKKK